MTRIEMPDFFRLPYQSNNSLKDQKSYVHSLLLLLSKVNVLMYVNWLRAIVKIGDIILKVLILINTKVQWHMLNRS